MCLLSLWQHRAAGTMQAYAKIDSGGRIYLLGPTRMVIVRARSHSQLDFR
jgi:hypothetical protein